MTESLPESSRESERWFQHEHALELFRERRLRLPSDARLVRKDPRRGKVHASGDGEDGIVEYMNDRGLWEVARVTWETFQAIARAQ
jgi:hypothetical protein